MAKNTFASWMFKARTFLCGLWAGVDVEIDHDFTHYGSRPFRSEVEFEQAYHNMPWHEFVEEIYNQGWHAAGLGISSAAELIALVQAEFDKTQDAMDITKLRPNGILQLMTVTTRGDLALADASMVVDSGAWAIRAMMVRFEALWITDPELILTDATWARVLYYDGFRLEDSPTERRHWMPSWTEPPDAYDYLEDSTKSFYQTGNSPAAGVSPSPSFLRYADNWFGVSGESAYLKPTSPQEFKAKMDLMPPGERVALMRFDSSMPYPVQQIWITGATQSGNFKLKFTYRDENGSEDGGVTTTATFDAADPVWDTLYDPGGAPGNEAAQQRIKIPEGLRALSNITGNNIEIFARTVVAATGPAAGVRVLELTFTDPAKRGGVWPYDGVTSGTDVEPATPYTPEATFEMTLERVDVSLHEDTTVNVNSDWIAWGDGWKMSDSFDDNHETITISTKQDLRPRMNVNWRTWLAAFMAPWWQEYFDIGGLVDGILFDFEGGNAGVGHMWSQHNADYGPNGHLGANAFAKEEFFKAFAVQDWYTTIFRPQLDDTTHGEIADGSHTYNAGNTNDGWRVLDWTYYSARAEDHRLLQEGIIDPCLTYFPDVKAYNYVGGYGNNGFNWFGTGTVPKCHGLGSIVGTHQMRDVYGGAHYSTPSDHFPHPRPNPEDNLTLRPSTQVIKRMQRVDDVTTLTCFDATEQAANLNRGSLHFFDAMKVGYEIQWRNTNTTYNETAMEPWCPEGDNNYQPTKEITAVTVDGDGHTYMISVDDPGPAADTTDEFPALFCQGQDKTVHIRVMDPWVRFAGRVYVIRMRANSSTYPLAHYWYDDIAGQSADYRIMLAESMIHAKLCGEVERVTYPATFTGDYFPFMQDVIDDIDVRLPYDDIRPITRNIYTLTWNPWDDDFIISGATLPDGTVVFRITLRQPMPNADEPETPALVTQATDYVDFLTMSGLTVRVPGVAVALDEDLPYGWWVVATGTQVDSVFEAANTHQDEMTATNTYQDEMTAANTHQDEMTATITHEL